MDGRGRGSQFIRPKYDRDTSPRPKANNHLAKIGQKWTDVAEGHNSYCQNNTEIHRKHEIEQFYRDAVTTQSEFLGRSHLQPRHHTVCLQRGNAVTLHAPDENRWLLGPRTPRTNASVIRVIWVQEHNFRFGGRRTVSCQTRKLESSLTCFVTLGNVCIH